MKIVTTNSFHNKYAEVICDTIADSAKVRGTGIAKRSPEYIVKKIESGNAVIALEGDKFAGFCYIETWSNKKYVVHSGLIVHPDFRNLGLAKKIKKKVFDHSKKMYPDAKIFGITTGLAVMKINAELGYKPVTFSELTDDDAFWNGCKACRNYDILTRNDRKMCLCTGMLHDPKAENSEKEVKNKVWTRLKRIKQALFLKNK
ncbi:GNAT family N-acetyltransferase [Flavicella sp.]|uniref:GNAT family N-acetyltransferase n=1 Tax=Flavicella sp. TaxID=2957742 RepID=UPI00262C6E56|nr:GNAT family N-acetyltransferase [Flavicella sp.]MDG1804773.1 GNAT family N-acetyltransferase [Flavicella sp.]MDG2280119.1 GNAT family N-acetyltransferase [Flavicella sp.]